MEKEPFYSNKMISRFYSAIQYAFSGEYKLFLLEKFALKNAKYCSFLNFIYKQLPNDLDSLNTKCILQIMISFGNEVENDVGYDLALIDYKNMKNKITQSINPHLGKDEFNDKIAHNICVALLNLCYSKPGIFFSILPFFDKLLKVIGPERANKVAGSESLLFYSNPDIESFKKLKIDPTMILLFFQYPVIFSNLSFCKAMQSKFSEEFIYPKVLPACDVDMSFLNTTI